MPKAPNKEVSQERKTQNGTSGDFLHGAKFAPFDLVGGPVDLANAALGLINLDHPEPFMGSDYLINRYADLAEGLGSEFRRPTNNPAENGGRLLASLATGVNGARAAGADLLETLGDNAPLVQKAAQDALSSATQKIEQQSHRMKLSPEEFEAFTNVDFESSVVNEFTDTIKKAAKEGTMQPDIAKSIANKILDSGLSKEEQYQMIYRLVDTDAKDAGKAFKKDLEERKSGGLASLFKRVITT